MKQLFTVLLSFLSVLAHAQKAQQHLYKGTVGTNMPVVLYLRETTQECTGEPVYEGMYQYTGKSKWLQLAVTAEKDQLVLIEDRLTGILLLRKLSNTLTGIWVSPDGKRQLKVNLIAAPFPDVDQKKTEATYFGVNEANNDC